MLWPPLKRQELTVIVWVWLLTYVLLAYQHTPCAEVFFKPWTKIAAIVGIWWRSPEVLAINLCVFCSSFTGNRVSERHGKQILRQCILRRLVVLNVAGVVPFRRWQHIWKMAMTLATNKKLNKHNYVGLKCPREKKYKETINMNIDGKIIKIV